MPQWSPASAPNHRNASPGRQNTCQAQLAAPSGRDPWHHGYVEDGYTDRGWKGRQDPDRRCMPQTATPGLELRNPLIELQLTDQIRG